jgi:hypothetical protein
VCRDGGEAQIVPSNERVAAAHRDGSHARSHF